MSAHPWLRPAWLVLLLLLNAVDLANAAEAPAAAKKPSATTAKPATAEKPTRKVVYWQA